MNVLKNFNFYYLIELYELNELEVRTAQERQYGAFTIHYQETTLQDGKKISQEEFGAFELD
ncbi:hypothetical protein BpHYR1_046477 [Brachionus plicatilis]|uniref:Uncharacterized protein n=1 Tax=Brachionus plicatilis TaxID=10195 RepID=A0A3M7PN92_BRAPC|nr:hypothetical protein BpHYR1_046477 [Brachionus plicatilis]